MATVMVFEAVGTVFPYVSWSATCGEGAIGEFCRVFTGWTMKPIFTAPPGVMENEAQVAEVSVPEVADSVYVPAVAIDRVLKLETPLTAATAVVPESAPGPVATARVMLAAEAVRFPLASSISTCTAGVMVAPAAVLTGWTMNASAASGPALMVTLAVDGVRLPLASSTSTWTAGVIVAVEAAFDGWTMNASFASGPGLTLKLTLVAEVSPVEPRRACTRPPSPGSGSRTSPRRSPPPGWWCRRAPLPRARWRSPG